MSLISSGRSLARRSEGRWAGWAAVAALSALVHFALLFVALPLLPEPAPLEVPAPPEAPEEQPVAILLEPEEPTPAPEPLEAPTEPAEAPPEPAELPPPREQPKEPPREQPKEPEEKQEPPPEEKEEPQKEQVSAQNKIAVDVPLVPEESEPPPDTPYVGAQDRRVEQEEQPRERALTPAEDAPPSLAPPQVAAEAQPQDDAQATPPPPQEPAPTPAPTPPQEAEAPPQEPPAAAPTPAPQEARPAERAGAPGAPQEAAPQPAPEEGAAAQAPSPDLALPAPGAPELAPAASAPPTPAPGQRGTGGKINLDRAIAIDPNRYDAIFGSRDNKAREREANRTDRFLGRWEKRAKQMRASLENFTPRVRYGNQMLINTRRSVYATYLARVHRTIHAQWALGYLRQLDTSYPMGHPMQDPNLNALIELVIDGKSGQVQECNIVSTSGQLEYDAEAVRICLDSSPGTPAPAQIVSPDGQVYIHWNFWRDTRQCGTFGASIFVLDTDGKLDTWKVKENIDDLEKAAP